MQNVQQNQSTQEVQNSELENTQKENLKPSDLSQEQDMLLLAGSKMSFRELYTREMSLPTKHGKFYRASDVDDLFVLINGLLTDISEQTYRQNKTLANIRKENNDLVAENDKLANDNSGLSKKVQELTNQVSMQAIELHNKNNSNDQTAELQNQLDQQKKAYSKLAQTAADKITRQQQVNQALADQIKQLQNRA